MRASERLALEDRIARLEAAAAVQQARVADLDRRIGVFDEDLGAAIADRDGLARAYEAATRGIAVDYANLGRIVGQNTGQQPNAAAEGALRRWTAEGARVEELSTTLGKLRADREQAADSLRKFRELLDLRRAELAPAR